MPARAMLPKDRWRALSTTGKVALVSGTSIVLVAGGGGVLAAWSQSASLVSGTLSTGNVTSSFTNTGTNQWTTPVANLVPAGFGTRAPAYSLRRMDRKSSSFLKSRGAADRVGE